MYGRGCGEKEELWIRQAAIYRVRRSIHVDATLTLGFQMLNSEFGRPFDTASGLIALSAFQVMYISIISNEFTVMVVSLDWRFGNWRSCRNKILR
ncbi:hypothetical protein NMG60_11026340 [Bertholletia excelsa]